MHARPYLIDGGFFHDARRHLVFDGLDDAGPRISIYCEVCLGMLYRHLCEKEAGGGGGGVYVNAWELL
jgi:hypothetical protein